MSKRTASFELIKQQALLPLYFHSDLEVSIEVLKALYAGNIRAVEYTNRGGAALANFKALKELRDAEMPGLELGIGTIKNEKEARSYLDAGADFIVSPGIVPAVGKLVHEAGLLWIPGCMTATEIILAEESGAELVKLFPGNILGPGFVSAIKDLFPAIAFMPTGGVDIDKSNLDDWFKSGVVAVGMGSKLITKKLLEDKNYSELTSQTIKALALVKSCK